MHAFFLFQIKIKMVSLSHSSQGTVRARRRNRVRDVKRSSKTKARTKDLDQIHSDLSQNPQFPLDPDLPGLGQHYCVHCARHFISTGDLGVHLRTKLHKKRYFVVIYKNRIKVLKEEPYTQKEAEAAAGLGTDNGSGRSFNFYSS